MESSKMALICFFVIAGLFSSAAALTCYNGVAALGVSTIQTITCSGTTFCKNITAANQPPQYMCANSTDGAAAVGCNAAGTCYCNTDNCNVPMYNVPKSGSEMIQVSQMVALLLPFVFAFVSVRRI